MSDDGILYFSGAIVLVAMILAFGFGKCDSSSPAVDVYKACIAKAKDVKDCRDPFEKVTPTPSPTK